MRILRTHAQAPPSHASRSSAPRAPSPAEKPCGHRGHVGSCAACQRVQLDRWRAQLADAS